MTALVLAVGLLGCDSAETVPDEREDTVVLTLSDSIQAEADGTAQTGSAEETPSNPGATASDSPEAGMSDRQAEDSNTAPERTDAAPATRTPGAESAGTPPAARTPETESAGTPSATKQPEIESAGTPSAAGTPEAEGSESDPGEGENSSAAAPEDSKPASAMELKKVGSLQYYLYTPANPTSNMPLIIYLHGGTNRKADVAALLTTDGFPKYLYDGYYGDLRAYVAIPKLDSRYKGWAEISDQIRDLIKTVHTDCAIDMDKIALTGHSMGGTGTYQLQVKLPNAFACIAPMSGSIQNSEANVTALSKTRVWAFVGTEDTIVSPDSSRAIIGALQERGAAAAITELEGAAHADVPSLAYKNADYMQWLVHCGE